MNNQHLNDRFFELSTPLIADACVRLGLPVRMAPCASTCGALAAPSRSSPGDRGDRGDR